MTALRVGWDLLLKKLKSLDRGAPTEWLDGQMVLNDRWQAAARDGDRRYDAAIRLAAYWRTTTIAAAAVGVGLAGGWWWEAQKPQVVIDATPLAPTSSLQRSRAAPGVSAWVANSLVSRAGR